MGICQHTHVPAGEHFAARQCSLRMIVHPVDDHIAGSRATLTSRSSSISAHVINVHLGSRGHVHVLYIRSLAGAVLQPFHFGTGIDEAFRHHNSPRCG